MCVYASLKSLLVDSRRRSSIETSSIEKSKTRAETDCKKNRKYISCSSSIVVAGRLTKSVVGLEPELLELKERGGGCVRRFVSARAGVNAPTGALKLFQGKKRQRSNSRSLAGWPIPQLTDDEFRFLFFVVEVAMGVVKAEITIVNGRHLECFFSLESTTTFFFCSVVVHPSSS